MVSSIFKKTGTLIATPIAAETKFLSTPVQVVGGELSPAFGGHMRIWFCVITTSGDSTGIAAMVDDNLTNKFYFNADNSYEVKSGGLYWFDIPIEEGDNINLVSSTTPDAAFTGQEITKVTLLRFQKIVFGA